MAAGKAFTEMPNKSAEPLTPPASGGGAVKSRSPHSVMGLLL